MPHKHKRSKLNQASTSHDLPPSSIAVPIPVGPHVAKRPANTTKAQKRKESRKANRRLEIDGYGIDDTPKAFTRLMQVPVPGRKENAQTSSAKSDARPERKTLNRQALPAQGTKRKRGKSNPVPHDDDGDEDQADDQNVESNPAPAIPTILPGERLSDFSARVNHALPIAGLAGRRTKRDAIDGVKERQTRNEKKMHQMQARWREEDARIREAREEWRAEQEEEDAAVAGTWNSNAAVGGPMGERIGKRGRKARREEDPWAVLKSRREKPAGLHDVVQAPPELASVKAKFKVRDGAGVQVLDVPGKAGSLRKREELGEERRSVIERYRKIMEGKRLGV